MSTKSSESIRRIPIRFGNQTAGYYPTIPMCYLNKGTYFMSWNSAIIGTNMNQVMYFITADFPYSIDEWVELMGLNKYSVNAAQQTTPYIVSISNTIVITHDATAIFPYINPFAGANSGWATCTGGVYDQMNYLNIMKVG